MKIKSILISSLILMQVIVAPLTSFAINIDDPPYSWESVGELSTPREYIETIAYKDKIYLFGGRKSNEIFNTAECYDTKTKELTVLPNMPMAKYQFGIEIIDDKIYCFGGISKDNNNEFAYTDRVDIYNPQTNQWEHNPNIKMNKPRGSFRSVRVGDVIYFISGGVGYMNYRYNLVEAYNIKTNTWEKKSDAPFAKTEFSAYYHNGKIYCEGGYPESEVLYIYNIESDTWTTDYSPIVDDESRGIVLKDDYAVFIGGGGFGDSSNNLADRIYDLKNNKWSQALYLKPIELDYFQFQNSYPSAINNEAYYPGVGEDSRFIYKLSLEDKRKPAINYTLSPTGYTNSHVEISIYASDDFGVKRIILPNGNSVFSNRVNFSVHSNGVYSFACEDINGNISLRKIIINNIDKKRPTVSISKNPSTEWTNTDVDISIKADD